MDDNLVHALGTATWTVCAALTSAGQAALQASLDRACAIRAGFSWERRAAAHAEFFTALSDCACDRYAALVLRYGAELAYGLMIGAGHSADVIVVNSRKRMLAHLRAGDAAEATREMEKPPLRPQLHGPPGGHRRRVPTAPAAGQVQIPLSRTDRGDCLPRPDSTRTGWPRWRDDQARGYWIPPMRRDAHRGCNRTGRQGPSCPVASAATGTHLA